MSDAPGNLVNRQEAMEILGCQDAAAFMCMQSWKKFPPLVRTHACTGYDARGKPTYVPDERWRRTQIEQFAHELRSGAMNMGVV